MQASERRIGQWALESHVATIGCGLVLGCVAVAAKLAAPSIFVPLPFAGFFLAVTAAAWLGSHRAWISCMGLLVLAHVYYFTQPYLSFVTSKFTGPSLLALIGFSVVGTVIGLVVSYSRNVQRRAVISRNRSQTYLDQLEAVMGSAIDSIIIMDQKGLVLDFNPAAEAMFGYVKSEVVGREMAQFIIPEKYRDMHRRGLEKFITTGIGPVLNRRIEITALRADGSELDVELAIIPIVVDGQHQFTGYIRDITQRMQLDRQKDDFIRMASHELKTPVTSIKLNTQLLRRRFERRGEQEDKDQITAVISQLDRMTVLIDTLLDFSRVETGAMVLSVGRYDVSAAITETVAAVRATAPNRVISLNGHSGVVVMADRVRIDQVVTNLLTNALKFSAADKPVAVSWAQSDRAVTVKVTDEGTGIDQGNRERIFERYFRGYNGKEEVQAGLGLGLYLSAEIIKLHGGTIDMTSHPDHGSTFTFTIPQQRSSQ